MAHVFYHILPLNYFDLSDYRFYYLRWEHKSNLKPDYEISQTNASLNSTITTTETCYLNYDLHVNSCNVTMSGAIDSQVSA